jgi:predicted regulator of Ras-like GTPase activity (Roadblock/LC7/MglB family)
MSNAEQVKQEVQHIVQAFPDVLWIRVVSVDGLDQPAGYYDSAGIKAEIELDPEGDLYAPMTAASLSLSERIASEMKLGKQPFAVIAGRQGVHLVLPVGDGAKWVMSLGFKGQPAIDPILQYFKNLDYLAHLIPLL